MKLRILTLGLASAMLSACGGGSADAPPPPETGPAAVVPVITQQPVSLSVTSGQPASFSVAATGTAPLAYQWQRNGTAIAGATTATYSLTTTAPTDNGTVFRAVVSNVAGSATSNDASLIVVTAPPVLTITQQPANAAVTAGTSASFTVAATCSSGTLQIQWQRVASGSFADIAGATAASYAFTAVAADTGAQFRATLSCSGLSTTNSGVATLTVSAPSAVTLRFLGEATRAPALAIPGAIVREPAGTYAFISNNMIKRLTADQSAINFVTGANGSGTADGGPTVALFNQPKSLAIDAVGNLYVADTNSHTIRKVTPDGTVSTIAGLANVPGSANGTGAAARFSLPTGVAIGPDGNLYVADSVNNKVRRVTPAGVVTDVAGTTVAGLTNGPSGAAQFDGPFDVAVASSGDVFVADLRNHVIRRISTAGIVTTLAGSGLNAGTSPRDGTGSNADIPGPGHLAISGNTLYVYDAAGLIRAIDITTAAVTTFAGTPNNLSGAYIDGLPGHAYLDNSQQNGITPTGDGGLMIGDRRALRIADAAGRVRSIATSTYASQGSDTSTGVLAQLPFLIAVADNVALFVDSTGGIVVADKTAKSIRRIDPTGSVALLAGLPGSFAGVVEGVRNEAVFASVGDSVTVAPDGTVFTSDTYGVRRIAIDGTTTFLAGSATTTGYVDGTGPVTRFNSQLRGMAIAPNGDLFVADTLNQTIRRVNPVTGTTTTFAGVFGRTRIDGTLATAGFPAPAQLNTAPDGSLWVNDGGTLRHIALDGTVTSLSGPPTVRSFAIDTDGTIYIGAIGGLYSIAAGVTSGTVTATLLIPAGTELTVSPATPSTGTTIGTLALLGHKQIVMITQSRLVVATVP